MLTFGEQLVVGQECARRSGYVRGLWNQPASPFLTSKHVLALIKDIKKSDTPPF